MTDGHEYEIMDLRKPDERCQNEDGKDQRSSRYRIIIAVLVTKSSDAVQEYTVRVNRLLSQTRDILR